MNRIENTNGKVSTRKPSTRKPSTRKPSTRKVKGREKVLAYSLFALAILGLAISLPHLAEQLQVFSGTSLYFSVLLAIIIDTGMIACKLALVIKPVAKRLTYTMLAVCTMFSILFNSTAFASHAESVFSIVVAIMLGFFVPLYIMSLSFLGIKLLSGHKQ